MMGLEEFDKRFADGKVTVPFKRFLGYDRGEDGNLVINEEQAETVRRIYGLFLQGRSPHAIAKLLTAEGIPSPGGKEVWSSSTVKSILTNEKYKGDALLQKVYTVDFLTKQKKVNEGEVPQYYVENNHQAIISPSVFEEAQHQMAARHSGKNRASSTGVFSGRIKCADCGDGTAPRCGIPTANTAEPSGSATTNLTAAKNAALPIWTKKPSRCFS